MDAVSSYDCLRDVSVRTYIHMHKCVYMYCNHGEGKFGTRQLLQRNFLFTSVVTASDRHATDADNDRFSPQEYIYDLCVEIIFSIS